MKNNHSKQIVRACWFAAVLQCTSLVAAQAETQTQTPAVTQPATQPATQPEAQPETETHEQAAPTTSQAAPPAVAGAVIRHAPLNDSFLAEARFLFEVTSPDRAGKIVVHVISDASPVEAIEVEATLMGAGYVAVLPPAQVATPGFSYYVVERMPDGSEHPVFADEASPHHVRVTRTDADELEQERLEAHDGHRSTFSLAGEGVDFGDRQLAPGEKVTHDRYYKLEVGYAYSFFSAVEDVRISLVRVRGQAALFDEWAMPPQAKTDAIALGIDYGRAAVTLIAHDHVRLRGAMLLGASQKGFEIGGAASIVIGDPLGSNVDFGVETLTTLGTVTHLRLGFLATQSVPMGATIEVSSFPVGEDSGVRLLYDVGYRFDTVTAVTLRTGYQGRTSVTGGASLGLNFDYGF